MSEYDSSFVFVPIASLQRMRGMIDPQSGLASVNSIQIKLRDGADLDEVRRRIEMEGATPVGSTPQEFAPFVHAEIGRWAQVVKYSGARPE